MQTYSSPALHEDGASSSTDNPLAGQMLDGCKIFCRIKISPKALSLYRDFISQVNLLEVVGGACMCYHDGALANSI